MNRARLAVVCLAVVVISLPDGCRPTTSPDKVVHVRVDHPQMNGAIKKARASVGTFIAALQSPKPGQVGFKVKAKFEEGSKVEDIWLDHVTYDGTNFRGGIANAPERVKNVKFGEKATVAPAEISDWMYLDNRKLVGGETVRVWLETLSPAERGNFEKMVDIVVE
ncbi:MAG TPA: DUF2314 domain-containing protein [Planctomycetaceae bacterium]|nr:DUF2314 domain-containing protein [Planctomycetaceae bacterium]